MSFTDPGKFECPAVWHRPYQPYQGWQGCQTMEPYVIWVWKGHARQRLPPVHGARGYFRGCGFLGKKNLTLRNDHNYIVSDACYVNESSIEVNNAECQYDVFSRPGKGPGKGPTSLEASSRRKTVQTEDEPGGIADEEMGRPRVGESPTALPDINISHLGLDFEAGRVTQCVAEWAKITSDSNILRNIRGYKLEFTEPPIQTYLMPELRFKEQERYFLRREIARLLQKKKTVG